jgi:hypothetical protein
VPSREYTITGDGDQLAGCVETQTIFVTATPAADGSMSGERGSALVLAVLVMAILTLLGLSYL